jgi:hypothetical protein
MRTTGKKATGENKVQLLRPMVTLVLLQKMARQTMEIVSLKTVRFRQISSHRPWRT